ncbi:Ppx/GppA phosphatase family protein [Rhodospirillum sp. A1_3_36]|uniref:Ppx/GppA phosphatase family protein n=1 Tax=Rhodospirillum sp. A1_3_36 TaxID=3391666 RepID=UPI0039A53245
MRRRVTEGEAGRLCAALDLGTNNCRLLIAEALDTGFRVVDSFSRITRLGEGVRASGRLSRVAMDRTIAALAICSSRMDRHAVTQVRCVATAACRAAENVAEFVERARVEAGVDLEVIPAEEEARLALAGCAPLLEGERPLTLVFDIGGGSTELTLVEVRDTSDGPRPGAVLAVESLPLGVVTLSEAVGGGHLSPRLHADIVEHVRERLRPFDVAYGIADYAVREQLSLLGTSGTVTTVGAVALGLGRYDRNRVDGLGLSVREIKDVGARLLDMSPSDRVAHPCIGRERADLVLAGCAILQAILDTWAVPALRVADRGIREGLLADMMGTRAEGECTPAEAGVDAVPTV